MIHKKPSEYAGKTVKLKETTVGMRGKLFEVEDYWDRVDGKSWMACVGNFAVLSYSIRAGVSNNLGITIPLDDEVLYGKIDGYGQLIHVCELDTEKLCPDCLGVILTSKEKYSYELCENCKLTK